MTTTSKQWQLANDAAARYETVLVPAILGPFAKALVDWADLPKGFTVVDVGCGTGAAARFAAPKVGTTGQIIGTDLNASMLSVAEALPGVDGAPIRWREEPADRLSMTDDTVDVVLCAQTLQFVDNRHQALSEMRRILKPDKSAYLSLWCDIAQNPYFDALVGAIADHIGEDTAAGLRSAFNLSNLDQIRRMLYAAGFSDLETIVSEIALDLPSVAEFVPRHIQATPMGNGYNAASATTRQAILDQASECLITYRTQDGLRVPFRSHLLRAAK